MLQTFKLLLPALIPSWHFFDIITASPRIEFALLPTAHATPMEWQEFRPRPAHISFVSMLKRMFYNARWNESLFMVSCAERLIENPTIHSAQEILTRIKAELSRNKVNTAYLQFRIVYVSRDSREIAYTSAVYSYGQGA